MSKPTLTKLKNFSLLFDSPWYGGILDHVVRPLVLGQATVRNMSMIDVQLEGKDFIIKVDQFYAMPSSAINGLSKEDRRNCLQTDLDRTVIQMRDFYTKFAKAGRDLYLKLTDCDDIDQALSITNSFLKDGVNVIATRRESGMVYKAPFDGKLIEFTNPDDLFLFLGSLANCFMQRRGAPDPEWFKQNADEGFPF